MRTEELNYHLPEELIAQAPAEPRDSSRLLLCPRYEGDFETRNFHELPDLLNVGDAIVVNTARVMHARLFGYKYPTGAKIEVLLLERIPGEKPMYRALLRRKRRLDPGDIVLFPESDLHATVIESNTEIGEDVVELGGAGDIESEIERIGVIPLPPYITDYRGEIEKYQTVYSRNKGSVAAPTAGLHFTPELFDRLNAKGIERIDVHLRVGWGTFSPIRSETLEGHKLHAEIGGIPIDSAEKINEKRKNGGRIVAVGTTVTRLLETAVDNTGKIQPFTGSTDLYITPGYTFRAIDALITNFHLPKTSLLALVAAFMGTERTLKAYEFAVRKRYRFYSFGDAMLII